jgi:putative aldouronate transport system permease protein
MTRRFAMLNRDHVITENRKAHKMLYKTRKRQKIKKYDLQMLVLTLPALLWFVIFAYIPMGGIIVAFKSYKYSAGIIGSPWIGFKNFIFFFVSQDAWKITRNTVGYGITRFSVGSYCRRYNSAFINGGEA